MLHKRCVFSLQHWLAAFLSDGRITVALLTISNADERRFYEIEARENSWGARELERQIIQLNSANRSARLVPKAVNDFRGFRFALPVQQGS